MTQQKPPAAPAKGVLKIKVGITRDGTRGVSIYVGERLAGEWTDSRANALSVGEDFKVNVLDINGETLYNFIAPGKLLAADALAANEVAVRFEV